MTPRAQMRGWDVHHDGTVWRHTDDNSLAPASGGVERPCTACGLVAEAGYGPDPCIGWGDGPACCGHGIEQPARRLRHPTVVSLALVAAAVALVAVYLWVGVL